VQHIYSAVVNHTVLELNHHQYWLPHHTITPTTSATPGLCLFYDASDTGYGGYTVEYGGLIANDQWSGEEAQQSSTWWELRAVRLVLESFGPKLQNERVKWFTNNQNVVRIVLCGSKKPILQREALAIFNASAKAKFWLEPEWIPRAENEIADYISRIVDYDDWPMVFNELDRQWGPHTVDRFANGATTRFQGLMPAITA